MLQRRLQYRYIIRWISTNGTVEEGVLLEDSHSSVGYGSMVLCSVVSSICYICMYVYIYMYIYICIYICMYVYICVYIYVCVYICVYIYNAAIYHLGFGKYA
jgi:hypothetical protein